MNKMCTQISGEANENMVVMMDEICNKFLSDNRVNTWAELAQKMAAGKFNHNWCNKLHSTAVDYLTLRFNFPTEIKMKLATGTVFRLKCQMDRHLQFIEPDANHPYGGVNIIEEVA